ncbi:MAG: bifunctional 4-hydroxy-2-oxoglutarate aldolase/2-dehydro-3-deoxy-phosphogluconate aldolase [Actinobacteria bacterium]|nr:bifunctional 4-hydroxy-2-oxoglutarate aldolase/2-dehydro-3-deoxy-phosphogluconate aldolase [Actinomycetota bacterium]
MIEVLKSSAMMAIVRTASAAEARGIGRALVDAGVEVIEFTTSCPEVFSIIEEFAAIDNLHVGLGTALTTVHVTDAKRSGATFIVSPNTDREVIRATAELGMTSIPGVASATEVALAISAGAQALKLFPASTYGPGHLRALSDPFPHQIWVATGGVAQESVPEWFRAGAAAFGLGGPLLGGGVSDISRRVGLFKNEISQARKVNE